MEKFEALYNAFCAEPSAEKARALISEVQDLNKAGRMSKAIIESIVDDIEVLMEAVDPTFKVPEI